MFKRTVLHNITHHRQKPSNSINLSVSVTLKFASVYFPANFVLKHLKSTLFYRFIPL